MRKDMQAIMGVSEEYLGDFYSMPDNQVHSRVSYKQGIIHIKYYIKPGYSLTMISEKWLSEIFDYLIKNGYTCEEIELHSQLQEIT